MSQGRDDDVWGPVGFEPWDPAEAERRRKGKPADLKIDPPSSPRPIELHQGRPDWRNLLEKRGAADHRPKKCLDNVLTTLCHCPAWQSVVRYNEFTDRTELHGALPVRTGHTAESEKGPWRDGHAVWATAWFNEVVGFEPSLDLLERSVAELARRDRWHPVRDYLKALVWDGTPRTDGMLCQMFGAENTPVNCAIGSKWLISAVARVMRPGCQVDHMLVLEGPQGTRKSTALRTLVGEDWFRNSPLDLRDKDAAMVLRGCWVYEFDELDSFRGRDATRVKSFITGRVDSYRPPYGRHPVDVPRECAFAGSTNEDQYLSDPTGNRRFWPVLCGAIDIPALQAARDQLWAEAYHRFVAGELWYVPEGGLATELRSLQGERLEIDPWVAEVGEWLARLIPSRRAEGVTTREALITGMGMLGSNLGKREETRVGQALRACGWSPVRDTRSGVRTRRYYANGQPQTEFAQPGF
jgi:putative DNA primase/helicase